MIQNYNIGIVNQWQIPKSVTEYDYPRPLIIQSILHPILNAVPFSVPVVQALCTEVREFPFH